jgi:predicted aspartyl protease
MSKGNEVGQHGWRFCALAAFAMTAATVSTCAGAASSDINAVSLRWPEAGRASIPFTRGVNHILVEVEDGAGRSFNFFVDTGATLSVVTPAVRENHEFGTFDASTEARAYGASGQISGAPALVRVQDLALGGLLIEEAVAVVVDLASVAREMDIEVHGIIGFNLLSRMTTVIDYANGAITFSEPGAKALEQALGPPVASVGFELLMGALIRIEGRVNGGPPIDFIVDIGSRYTALNPAAGEGTGIGWEPFTNHSGQLGLGTGSGIDMASGEADRLSFGELEFTEPRLYSIPLPVFDTLGLSERPSGLLGNDLLQRYTVAIDYPDRELRFWQAPRGATRRP